MMMIDLHGGFGEKGRTCVGVRAGGLRLLLDAGIKVGARPENYHPALAEADITAIDALFISHAHEDHVGALPWLLARGFRGRIFMTAEARAETPATLAAYAMPDDLARAPFPLDRVELFRPGQSINLGGVTITTGRSGHVAGGVWLAVEADGRQLVYSADIAPDSAVFAMDPTPHCDALLIDASYGVDPISGEERAATIAEWVARHASGCLLPTPLYGRSLELIAAIDAPLAICASMRPALQAQIAAADALRLGVSDLLVKRLAQAEDWRDGDALPRRALLCDDGMGTAGPSARLIPRADTEGMPILLTGHLPAGSPGDRVYRAGRADWIRMPTHPTLPGLIACWETAGQPLTLGHSCENPALEELARHINRLSVDLATGDSLSI
ncbi:MBL fold metallo-hydrolase [Terrarubrum flagellatum]|uniref:MBL fold metallo-hydrolase n=1 Tax=Terrirubrum flagellatum TaxID=2895980 RepID=UPI003144D5F2